MNEPAPRDELGREETIFHAAVELRDPAKRAAYLDLACDNEPELRARIEALLKSDAADGFFTQPLAKPALKNRPPQPEALALARVLAAQLIEKPGDTIGRYKLREKLGEGGCGVVYMAEQDEPIRRRVALKIIKLGMDTKSVIARFDAERQALALMDHPNIAKILDAGVTETPHPVSDDPLPTGQVEGRHVLSAGRPYFVMELVGGVKITDYCDQNHLTTRQRLDLFIQVCRAIQHAHQKGVIHRDIKPSNVLVATQDGVPVPKVIDFGIAKATQGRLTDQTVFTAFEQFLGTPAYMSPEQTQLGSLDVDTRSDIYSLGVLLYELLTGKTPFDSKELLAAGLDAMRRTIQEKEPPTPSTRLQQELLTQQVQTPDQSKIKNQKSKIAADLDCIVMKCLEKDRARRYETVNGLATDVARHLNNEPVVASPPGRLYRFKKLIRRNRVTSMAAVSITMALVLGISLSVWQALRAMRAEREQSRLRQQAEMEASKSKEVSNFLEEMLKGAGPSAARGRDATMLREILDKTAERVEKELQHQPEVQGDLNVRLALTYRDLSDFAKAEPLLERAVKEYRASSANGSCKLAVALGILGSTQKMLVKYDSLSRSNAEEGLRLARNCGDQKSLATCLYYMARSLRKYGQIITRDEEPYLREAIAIHRELGDDPAKLASCLISLAFCLDEPKDAEPLIREALVLDRQQLGDEHPRIAGDLYNLAECLFDQQKTEEAKARALEALELGRRTLGKDHQDVHMFLGFLLRVLIVRGEWEEGERLLKSTVEESPSAQYWLWFAKFEARRQNWAAAADYSARAFGSARTFGLRNWSDELPCWEWAGMTVMLLRAGRLDDYRAQCHSLLERLGKTNDVGLAAYAGGAALLLPVEGPDFDRACQIVDRAAPEKECVDEGLRTLALWKALADYRRGRFESAREWASRAGRSEDPRPCCKMQALYMEAMARTRLKDIENAKAALLAGDGIRKEKYANTQSFVIQCEWLTADFLGDEARTLIEGEPTQAESAK
jgi:serine/threonine protein kinase